MPSFGETLRRERESRRIPLREVSESTKISMRYLEALESNDFRHLPGGVFNKGFVRAYAQFIGVDPDRLIEAYLVEQAAHGDSAEPHAADRGEPPSIPASGRRTALGIVLVILTCVVLVGVAAAAWWWWRGGIP